MEYYWRFRVTRYVLELRNIALVGHLIVESARRRRESRGLHYMVDFPDTSEEFASSTSFDKRGGPDA
jgi:L-aspartate oxidase